MKINVYAHRTEVEVITEKEFKDWIAEYETIIRDDVEEFMEWLEDHWTSLQLYNMAKNNAIDLIDDEWKQYCQSQALYRAERDWKEFELEV